MKKVSDIISGFNLKYPNLTRLHLILINATEAMYNLSIINPQLELMDTLHQSNITLFYNLEAYGHEVKTKKLKQDLEQNEKDLLYIKKKRGNTLKLRRQLMSQIRETYAKILALSNSCGLGLELKSGKTDVEKNFKRILTR